MTEFTTRLVYLAAHLKAGWPQSIPIVGTYPPEDWRDITVADLDNDGFEEIVLLDHGNSDGRPARLLVYRHDGTEMWSKELDAGFPYNDIPAIGDLLGDGQKEILVDAGSGGQLLALRPDGTSAPGQWPVHLEAGGLGKVIADLDHDGQPEVIGYSQGTVSRGGIDYRQLVVYNARGGLIRKWEVPSCDADLDAPRILPAVGNLDGEPDLEIVTVSGCDTVVAFKLSKDAGPLWSAATYGTFVASPVVADLDQDGTNEVVIAAFDISGGKRGGVYAFDHTGQRLPGWPVLVEESFSAAPAVADVDGDGELEICVPSWKSGLLHLIRRNGFEVDGWPVIAENNTSFRSSALIGDVDGDRRLDIVISSPGYLAQVATPADLTKAGAVRAWNAAGKPIVLSGSATYPSLLMESSGGTWLKAAPAVLTDLDHNGKLDIVAASVQDRTYLPPGEKSSRKNRSSLYVWELDTPFAPDQMPWPSRQRNPQHTGYFPAPEHVNQAPVISKIFDQITAPGGTFFPIELDQYVEDPDNLPEEITWQATGYQDLKITISTNRIAAVQIPSGAWTGAETIRFTAADPGGLQAETSVVFEVRQGYVGPVANHDQAPTLEDTAVEIDLLANDSDPAGRALSVAGFSKPGKGKLVRTPQGTFLYTPKRDANGTDTFTYTVSNGQGGFALGTVTVEITPVNDPPLAAADHLVIDEDTEAEIDLLANDLEPDGDPLSIVEFTQPQNGKLIRKTPSVFLYRPATNFFGTDQFKYSITDGHGETNQAEGEHYRQTGQRRSLDGRPKLRSEQELNAEHQLQCAGSG
ncbi:MAG: Ig-like domain-containing protein [Verrucomicrobiota bacterium]